MKTITTKTTTREYNGDGKLVKEVVTETTEKEEAVCGSGYDYFNPTYSTAQDHGASYTYATATTGSCTQCTEK